MRNKKNEYRDKYNKTKSALDTLQSEATQLRSTEASLRDKLKRTEQEVMLLTSENMQLQEAQSKLKDLTNEKTQLQRSLRTAEEALKSSNAAGTPQYDALVQRLQSKEESLRSLQRKVDRLRRRDPLLQFSLACSELHRLCPVDAEASAQDAGREEAEAAYQLLSEQYSGAQTEAWKSASSKGSVAAKAYLAAARHAVAASVPLSYYDAAIVVEGNVGEATTLLESVGYITESTPEDPSRLQVKAPSTVGVLTGPGPYGYLLALRYAKTSSFTIQSVHPIVSSELVENAQRCNVTYETARASGPGGQATNVTETQVYAKLTIDGRFAYTAEAQDSRSALNNKDAALEKLKQTKRLHYNDSLARKYRPEEVVATIVQRVKESGGLEVEDSYLQLVQDAVSEKTVSVLDGALAQFVATSLSEQAD
ncbi:peptide chain release factor 2 [Angomonas deanei]|uniref:RF-1 domain containing protein, putative n=1 Tax=Angomonas deanei TaxID=59799 RepID=A0A7G2CRB9_9TRYP|nr:peptide chain release factor 2 [Angomonas deanei]CAD2221053.1 RF-1 domain containing protein, putative [Angomonas deanei]|eukprot:EPY24759.1 peptide chain release factor 2 [Angomonas deanei]